MALDAKLFFLLNDLAGRYPIFDGLIIFLASYLQYILIVAFLLFFYFSADSKTRKVRVFLVAVISAAVARLGVTELIRFFYHRPRPFIVFQFHPLVMDDAWSFPSGHSTFFFAMAMAIYFYNKKWGIWFFVAAVLMNISRVIAGVHYPSDILGGAIIGIAIAYLVFYIAEKKMTRIAANI